MSTGVCSPVGAGTQQQVHTIRGSDCRRSCGHRQHVGEQSDQGDSATGAGTRASQVPGGEKTQCDMSEGLT